MKFLFSLFFFLFVATPLYPSEETAILEELIDSTKNKLEEEKKLLKLLNIFNETRQAFVLEPDSAKLATKLVNVSLRLQSEMEKSHLTDIFPRDFLEEITFFCQVGKEATHDSVQR